MSGKSIIDHIVPSSRDNPKAAISSPLSSASWCCGGARGACPFLAQALPFLPSLLDSSGIPWGVYAILLKPDRSLHWGGRMSCKLVVTFIFFFHFSLNIFRLCNFLWFERDRIFLPLEVICITILDTAPQGGPHGYALICRHPLHVYPFSVSTFSLSISFPYKLFSASTIPVHTVSYFFTYWILKISWLQTPATCDCFWGGGGFWSQLFWPLEGMRNSMDSGGDMKEWEGFNSGLQLCLSFMLQKSNTFHCDMN